MIMLSVTYDYRIIIFVVVFGIWLDLTLSITFIQDDIIIHKMDMQETTSSKVLSRKRRYVAFPEGSSFSVAVCATIGVIGNPNPAYLSYGLNWGVAYDLPNETWVTEHLNGIKTKQSKPNIEIHRRIRKDIFNQIESVMNNFGYNGRNCLMKAFCEAAKFFKNNDETIIDVMLNTIFSLPAENKRKNFHKQRTTLDYNTINREVDASSDCLNFKNDCNFSLLDLFLGKYSEPYY